MNQNTKKKQWNLCNKNHNIHKHIARFKILSQFCFDFVFQLKNDYLKYTFNQKYNFCNTNHKMIVNLASVNY